MAQTMRSSVIYLTLSILAHDMLTNNREAKGNRNCDQHRFTAGKKRQKHASQYANLRFSLVISSLSVRNLDVSGPSQR